ncbi:MAG: hypothetical protein JW762_15870 [Dehalococcoidales bacterium]|nr:hypothetical protein [Dehalococcoidales bacterium]
MKYTIEKVILFFENDLIPANQKNSNMSYLELKKASGQTRIFYYLVLALICIFSSVILPSCGESGTRILYSGSKVGDQICASYELFTGVDIKTFVADEGDKVAFSYVSSVEKGKLKMEIYNPDDILITSFSSNKTGTQELDIEKNGKHTIKITGNQTKGRYQISWDKLN